MNILVVIPARGGSKGISENSLIVGDNRDRFLRKVKK